MAALDAIDIHSKMLWIPKVFMQIQVISAIEIPSTSVFGSQSKQGCVSVQSEHSFTLSFGLPQPLLFMHK